MRWRSVTEWGVGGRDWVGGQERERTVLDEKMELQNTGIEFAYLSLYKTPVGGFLIGLVNCKGGVLLFNEESL